MKSAIVTNLLGFLLGISVSTAFVVQVLPRSLTFSSHTTTAVFLSSPNPSDDEEGAQLAAELFKMAQQKGIQLNDDDLVEEEEEDADDDEEEDEEMEEPNIPQGAINAFLGYDTGDVGEKLAGNVSLTDSQLYSEVKERVLDTAGGFVDFVKGADDNEEEDESGASNEYEPPTTIPDSELTAGEVVILVLDALRHNNVPEVNRGVEILFGYSSDSNSIKLEDGLTASEYADFLKETEYKVLFTHQTASIEKADYSFDGNKAFMTARLEMADNSDPVPVNFILSTTGHDEDSCWLIDSLLIRPQSMRRRRRR